MEKQLLLIIMSLLPMVARSDENGTCGDNLTWTYEEATKTLTIKGDGAMADYGTVNYYLEGSMGYDNEIRPWEQYIHYIRTIKIEEGVTEIGNFSFFGCSSITEIHIPSSISSIGEMAFGGCESLTSISIPDNVTFVGLGAFGGCSRLIKLDLGCGCKSIQDATFEGCYSLASVTIPSNITSIGNSAFSNCTSLTYVYISDSVKSLGDFVFQSCSNLTSIRIGNGVSSIGAKAFERCEKLSTVVIPNNVTSIGYCAFYECKALTSITIPKSVTSIEDGAFGYCENLESVKISDLISWCKITFHGLYSNPLYFAHHLFLNAEEVKRIEIPHGISSICDFAFSGFSSLTSLIIPDNITSIGNNAFYDCTGLTSVTIPNSVTSIGESAFYNCNNLKDLALPDNLRIIQQQTFDGCSSLKKIIIPKAIEYIYQYAFSNCGLEEVRILSKTPPFAFDNTFNRYDIPLYVPESAIESYKATSPWNKFGQFCSLDGGEVIEEQCAKPTIAYKEGRLAFDCVTEDVVFHYDIQDSDIHSGEGNAVDLSATFIVSVYATCDGYKDSEVATATLCWIDVDPRKEGITGDEDVVTNVKATPVLIQANGNALTINGAPAGTPIHIYDLSGRLIATATAAETETRVAVGSGEEVLLVKVGDKVVKVAN